MILCPDGCVTCPVTAKERDSGRRVGVAVIQKCCACRKNLRKDRSVSHVQNRFYCSICKMHLFRENKVDPETGRTMTCLEEFVCSDEVRLCCDDFTHCKNFPKDKIINLRPGRSSNKRGKRH